MKNKRQVALEISKSAFKYNIEQIRRFLGKDIDIMPVIKANAYGTYINKNLEMIKDFKIIAVAIVEEAVELRNIGFKNEIFVLNQPYIEDIENIIKYNITVGVASKEFIEEIGKYNEKVKMHLEIETGMGRTGVYIKDLEEVIKILKLQKNVVVEGVYTHLSSADIDEEYTKQQMNTFQDAVNILKNEVNTLKYVHCSASNGLLNFQDNICNLVRPGIIMYGYESSNTTFDVIHLKPIAKLKAKISFIKDIEAGDSISYGRSFVSKSRMKIATVGIGYADGVRRALSNKAKVVINGRKASIVGKVCMDSFMVDVTEIENVKIGDEVYIWDNDNITLEDIALKCDTINYEILCTISNRVPREFVE